LAVDSSKSLLYVSNNSIPVARARVCEREKERGRDIYRGRDTGGIVIAKSRPDTLEAETVSYAPGTSISI